MAVAAPLCLTAILTALSPGALAGVIPAEGLPDAALTSDYSLPDTRVPRGFFDLNAQETDDVEIDFTSEEGEAEPSAGKDPKKDEKSLADREKRKIRPASDLSESDKSALNGEIEKEVSDELKKARALMEMAEELGEPLIVAEAEESLTDLIESDAEPSHAIRKRAPEKSMSDVEEAVVNDIIDTLTLSKVHEPLEDLLAKDKISKRSEVKGVLEELKDKHARREVTETFEELLPKDELKKIDEIKEILEDFYPNDEIKKRSVVKIVLDKTAKINGANEAFDDVLVKDELAIIHELEEILEEMLPKDKVKKRHTADVLEELLANDKKEEMKEADESEIKEIQEILQELFFINKLTKISEAEELLQELIPKSKPFKRSLKKGKDSLPSEEEAVEELEEALGSEPSEGGRLVKRSSSNDEDGSEDEDQEKSAVDELTEGLRLSTKDRHKRKTEEQVQPDLDLLELKRMSKKNTRASSEKSMIKDLIEDVHLQTENDGELSDDKILETVLEPSDLTKREEARQKRGLGTLPRIRPRAISPSDSEELEVGASESEEPEGHRQTRSSAEKQSAQEPSSLEDDSSLLEPPGQGSEEETRRRRSVSKTNNMNRFSRYERETAKEHVDEDPKNLAAENFDPYLLGNGLELKPGRNLDLVDKSMQSSDVNLQEQMKDINAELLKSPKILDDVDLQEGGEEMPHPNPAKREAANELRWARQLMPGEFESETVVPQYVQDYNAVPTVQPVPESGQAADSFWYGVSPDDELKEEAGANTGDNNTIQAESKGHEKKKTEQDSPKEAKPNKNEGEKKTDEGSASKDKKKSAASDTKREAKSVEKENHSDDDNYTDDATESRQ